MPVSSLGSTTCPGTATVEVRAASLYQWMRNRLRGSASSGPTWVRASVTRAGIRRRVGQLGEGGQDDAGGPEVRDGAVTGAWIDEVVLDSE